MSKKIIATVTILILSALTSSFFLYQNNLKEIESATFNYFKTGDERRGGLVIENSLKENRRKEYVLTKFDIQKPITTYVLQVSTIPNTSKIDIQFETFYLERTGINSFKVNDSRISRTVEYSFEDAVNLAKKQDVYKDNPDSSKIRNVAPITQEEIESNKKLQEQKQQQTQSETDFNNLPLAERQKQCFDLVKKLKKDLENAKKGDFTNIERSKTLTDEKYIAEAEQIIPQLEAECNKLK
jgi:hypothetical protein